MSDIAIEIKDLNVFYNSRPTLEDISLEIAAGSFVGVLGPNGAGKSTLLKVILGLIRPDQGQVRIFGHTPPQLRRHKHIIGYLPQRPLNNPHFPRLRPGCRAHGALWYRGAGTAPFFPG